MIYEMRTYRLHPGKLREYLHLTKTIGLPIREKYSKPLAYWYTDIGELNQIVQLWPYQDMADRERVRKALAQDPSYWDQYLQKAMPLVAHMESKILTPTEFSALK